MKRRSFLFAAGAAALPVRAANRIDINRISAITDEIARTPAAAMAFAHQYKLKWLELRDVPGMTGGPKEYFQQPVEFLKQAAAEFKTEGIRISFLNTSLLKYGMPDVEYPNPRTRPSPRFEKRTEELKKAMEAAHILGTDKVRVFAFTRVTEPEKVMGRIAEILNAHAELAAKEKIYLLLENEASCNIATGADLALMMKMVPSKWVGINWDPENAARREKVPFPDGYELLPSKRILNVQIKGRNILPGPELMDWAAVFRRLEKDWYKGQVGLETHIFGEVQIQKSHESLAAILKIV